MQQTAMACFCISVSLLVVALHAAAWTCACHVLLLTFGTAAVVLACDAVAASTGFAMLLMLIGF